MVVKKMSTYSIGEKVKYLRKKIGMSQEALCVNTCSQSEISRIENDKIIPSSFVLQKIAEKLGVSVDYFNGDRINNREDYLEEVKKQLERARRSRDYKEIESIINFETNNPSLMRDVFIETYFRWHKGICLYHLYNDKKAALNILKPCVNLRESYFAEIEVEILNSIGIILRNEKDYTQAAFYLERALKAVKEFPYKNKKRLLPKIKYNLAKVYTDSGSFDDSLRLCKKGINYCRLNEDMFLFAEFYYQTGRNWILKGNKEQGLVYWKKAIEILRIQDNELFIEMINHDIDKYKLNLQTS